MERAAAKFLWNIWKNNSPGTPSTYGKMNYRGIDVKIMGIYPQVKKNMAIEHTLCSIGNVPSQVSLPLS